MRTLHMLNSTLYLTVFVELNPALCTDICSIVYLSTFILRIFCVKGTCKLRISLPSVNHVSIVYMTINDLVACILYLSTLQRLPYELLSKVIVLKVNISCSSLNK
jgi:hypothetical protein